MTAAAERWESCSDPNGIYDGVTGERSNKAACIALAGRWALELTGPDLDLAIDLINRAHRNRGATLAEISRQDEMALPLQFVVQYTYALYARRPFLFTNEYVRRHVTNQALEDQITVAFIRDIIPNPYKTVIYKFEWWTTTISDLAYRILRENHPDELPILADALQDQGCDCEILLNHLRTPMINSVKGLSDEQRARFPLHLPGCWGLQAILTRTRVPIQSWPLPVAVNMGSPIQG